MAKATNPKIGPQADGERLQIILGAIIASTESITTHIDEVAAVINETVDSGISEIISHADELADESESIIRSLFDSQNDLIESEITAVIDNTDTKLIELAEALANQFDDIYSRFSEQASNLSTINGKVDLLNTKLDQVLDFLKDETPSDWKDSQDLLPDEGKFVFGVFAGTGEDLNTVSTLLGRTPELTTIYWDKLTSPIDIVNQNLEKGIVTRVEFELTTALCDNGAQAATLWKDIAAGNYDDTLRILLSGAGKLASICHEADLLSEQGGYPKRNPQAVGTKEEFAQMWRHVITIGREVSPETKWFWDMSGGFGGPVGQKWGNKVQDEGSDGMFPGRNYVDFVGWDGFDWFGVRDKFRTPFGDMMTKFGRWDWYKANFGNRGDSRWKPLMIGETAVCESDGTVIPADQWMDDMRTWLHNHPDVTHLIYFSVKYDTHDRRLSGGPEKQKGTQNAGQDDLLD